jgi:hypothetical protein
MHHNYARSIFLTNIRKHVSAFCSHKSLGSGWSEYEKSIEQLTDFNANVRDETVLNLDNVANTR